MIEIDMEMPEKCSECRMQTDYYFCSAMPKNFCGNTEDNGKPEWCPLKEVHDNGGWISVKDKMPGNNKDILIYGEWTGQSGTKYREIFLSGMDEFIYQGNTPIAWMPLPEPPKEG